MSCDKFKKGVFPDYLFDTWEEVCSVAKSWINDHNYNKSQKFLEKLSPIEYFEKYNL